MRSGRSSVSGAVLIALVALVGGAFWGAYTQIPIVEYSLSAPSSYYLTYDSNGALALLKVSVTADNTGPTDCDINVTISAVNATISLSSNGAFVQTLSEANLEVKGGSHAMGAYSPIYVKPDSGVSGFMINITNPIHANAVPSVPPSPFDLVTSLLVSWGRLTPVSPQTVQYVKNPTVSDEFDLIV